METGSTLRGPRRTVVLVLRGLRDPGSDVAQLTQAVQRKARRGSENAQRGIHSAVLADGNSDAGEVRTVAFELERDSTGSREFDGWQPLRPFVRELALDIGRRLRSVREQQVANCRTEHVIAFPDVYGEPKGLPRLDDVDAQVVLSRRNRQTARFTSEGDDFLEQGAHASAEEHIAPGCAAIEV